jgi:ubiquitin C-terminal hydrolase
VGPRDATLDAGAAFRDEAENTNYRLIGILENHGRYHWTAKSLRDGGWYNCNDGTVNYLGTNVPSSSAAILIYERIH